MRPIPPALREKIADDPFMEHCIHPGCQSPPEWEHAFIYGGRQINEAWAIVPCCYHHHRGDYQNKRFNQWVALNRATEEDLAKYPKKNWAQEKTKLNEEFGPFEPYKAFREDLSKGVMSTSSLPYYIQDPYLDF